jgi:ribose 5-phosphate isomerase B
LLQLDHQDRSQTVVRSVAVGADHAGYELKEQLKRSLESRNIQVLDVGAETGEASDYPEYAHRLAQAVESGRVERGVLVCGTGIGMAMAANRHDGIRAAFCPTPEYARLSRAHNDANVLTLGGRFIPFELARSILEVFLDTPFEGGRHERRVARLNP